MNARALAWTMIFGSVYGIGHHPRARDRISSPAGPISAGDAADLTDLAMVEWDARFNSDGSDKA